MTTTYLPRDPRKNIPFFTDGDDVWFTSIGMAMLSAAIFLPLTVVSGWLGFGAPALVLSYVAWAIHKLYSGKNTYVRVGNSSSTRVFLDNWRRLDSELQLELADIYHSVVRIVDGIQATESSDIRRKLFEEIDRRAGLIRSVADEAELTRSQAVHDSVVAFDDHALETARLYIESFRQQRGEGGKS